MIAIYITISIAASAISFFIGAIIAAGSRAHLDETISRLRWHLNKIIREAETGTISGQTLENARKILTQV